MPDNVCQLLVHFDCVEVFHTGVSACIEVCDCHPSVLDIMRQGLVGACRVHAKHIGHSLFGDEAYGGAGGSAVSTIGKGKSLRYVPIYVRCHMLY